LFRNQIVFAVIKTFILIKSLVGTDFPTNGRFIASKSANEILDQ
jgi:hypothetical protein